MSSLVPVIELSIYIDAEPLNRSHCNDSCKGVVSSRIACESLKSLGLHDGSFVHLNPEAETI